MSEMSIFEMLKRKKRGITKVNQSNDVAPSRSQNAKAPVEVTSKRAVGRHRLVLGARPIAKRDPRFEATSGTFNKELYNRAYSFLDERRENEIQTCKRELKKRKRRGKSTANIEIELSKMLQERGERQREERMQAFRSQHNKKEKQAVESGKSAFYPNRIAKKQLELHGRYNELKETGALKKFLAKKRQRNAAKDQRWLPTATK